MPIIKLSDVRDEQIEISKNPIIIVENKSQKGYKTTHGFIGFGKIFISIYNNHLYEIEECEKEMEASGYQYSIGLWTSELLQGLNLTEIVDFVETGNLSTALEEKIMANTKTLPFRVGIYKNKPVLYYIGFEEYLFIYDLLMIGQHNIKIKFCKDCGRAFLPNTRGEYCPNCKNSNVRNKEKYKRLKEDPTRLLFTRLQQRIQKREKLASPYRTLFEKLAAKNKKIQWLEKWSELDKRYQKVKRHCMEYNPSMTESAWDNLLKNSKISSIKEFEEWIDLQEQANSVIEKNT